jgi:TolA-binding protein
MRLHARALDLEAVMESGREVPPAPDLVRARLLARARAVIATAETKPPLAVMVVMRPATRGWRIAVAAAVTLALAAAGATAALRARAARSPEVDPTARRSSEAPLVPASAPQPPTEQPAPPSASRSRPARLHRSVLPQESYAAELGLLQRAQSDYAGRDYSDALVLVAEHARRFPNGRMAEERDALRVRSLANMGRGDEARRALAAFAKHFPHSALLPRLRQSAHASEE